MSSLKKLLPTLLALILAFGAVSLDAKEKKGKAAPPPSKATGVIRAEVYKKMEVAQKAFEAKDYKASLAALDVVKGGEAKLNNYERATLYNLYAATYYSLDDVPKAIEAYGVVLKQPDLPVGLRDNSLYAMAQLHFISENYAKTIEVAKQWLSVVAQPSPEGYALLAQASYQMQNYPEAEKALLTSMRISKERGQAPKEPALALLRAIFYERKQYAKAAKVLEVLVANFPAKATYWQQLAGMRGLMGEQRQQLTTMHAAYRGRLLKSEQDLLNLARLYMVQEVPASAVRLISEGMKDKVIKDSPDNLQLFAQALSMAREYEQQIPVLKRLAEVTRDPKHYVYLGQAFNQLGQWKEAAAAFEVGLKRPGPDGAASIHMQLGTALFNAGEVAKARPHFVAASQSASLANAASGWVKFVDQELQRREAIAQM